MVSSPQNRPSELRSVLAQSQLGMNTDLNSRRYLRKATAQRRLREAYFVAIVTSALKHLRREALGL